MPKAMDPFRHEALKRMLDRRRFDIQNGVHDRMQTVRGGGEAGARRVDLDGPEAGVQEDLELDLIQIHSEMIGKITEALARVDAGDYGRCRECGEDIAGKRLRALPFASRCKECQETFETAERRARQLARHPAIFSANGASSHDGR